MNTRLRNWLVAIAFLSVVASCANRQSPTDAVLGDWEKQDSSLPPIQLLLSKDGTQILARLRLSGVELNGTAQLEGEQLRLTFPGRDEMKGRFTSATTLLLGMGDREFLLSKRP